MIERLEGLLPIDKPLGPTSHDLVARVRAGTGVRRVGHTGTLDPPATGLLLLLLGQATRLARFVPSAPKTYRGVLELGVVTTSDDLAGDVVRRHEGALPSGSEILAAAALRVGRQLQVPPAFSARHVDGQRLYRSARRGVLVEAPPSEIVIDRFHLAPTEAEHLWTYELVVSTGTYVRAAVRDLGAALGCGAAVASLRRTAIGPFRVEHALTLPAEGFTHAVFSDPATLHEFLILSDLHITRRGGPPAPGQDSIGKLISELITEPTAVVTESSHHKCARCWKHLPDVGTHAEHPTLCGRCVEAVG